MAHFPSDPPQHAGDPPVAGHDNLTDHPAALVVVWPRVETTQGFVVAPAEALALTTVLAAIAQFIQTTIQFNSDFSLQKDTGMGITIAHVTNAISPKARAEDGGFDGAN